MEGNIFTEKKESNKLVEKVHSKKRHDSCPSPGINSIRMRWTENVVAGEARNAYKIVRMPKGRIILK